MPQVISSRDYIPAIVGQKLPIEYSFRLLLKNFLATNQTLVGGSIVIVSQTPSVVDFIALSSALVTSARAAQEGMANDAVIGRYDIKAAGQATIKITVDAINPIATYVGFFTFNVEDVPTP